MEKIDGVLYFNTPEEAQEHICKTLLAILATSGVLSAEQAEGAADSITAAVAPSLIVEGSGLRNLGSMWEDVTGPDED